MTGIIVVAPISTGEYLVDWRDAGGVKKSCRAGNPETVLRLVAHALREQGQDVPASLCIPPSFSPPAEIVTVREGRPVFVKTGR